MIQLQIQCKRWSNPCTIASLYAWL